MTLKKLSGHQKWRQRHPERARKSDKERRLRQIEKNPLRYLLKNVRSRAKKSGIEFSINEDDLEWPHYCPVLGMELIRNSKKGWSDNTHSIDRIDNTKGYVPGNVKIISWRANSLKSNASIEELQKVLDYMKSHKEECVSSADKAA